MTSREISLITKKKEPVWLYVYDLSVGIASAVTFMMGAPIIKGVWHSSLVLHNREVEFGRNGITCTDVGVSALPLVNKYYLGETSLRLEILLDYLRFLNKTKFKAENYNVLDFNCHVFTNFLANELVHKNIPQYLLDLPRDCALSLLGTLFDRIAKTDSSLMLPHYVNEKNISCGRNFRF